jgi:hypothetical protein
MREKLCLVLLLVSACDKGTAPAPSASAPLSVVPSASASASPPTPKAEAEALSIDEFKQLFSRLSEPDRYFFSDNYVSNETSYLQVADALERRAQPNGAYIGVGPEQNFTYIALARPKLAFIVDIRRGNAIEQLLYKAIFQEANTRSQFLHVLLGRPYSEKDDPKATGGIDAVLAHVERAKPNQKLYAETHARLRVRLEKGYGIVLSDKDIEILANTHRAFFDKQLDLRFELHGKNFRDYPSLKDLFAAKDPAGKQRGFLATDELYQRVTVLQRQNRVIPVVGDFAGDHALQAIGKELKRRDVPVSAFYVSNVEQYVMDPDKWKAYVANIDTLPSNEKSLFIRCYLDQGKKHPQELAGHRTATVLQLFDHFRWKQRSKGYGSFYQLATDGVLDTGNDPDH